MTFKQDYTLTLYLHQHWQDKRLSFGDGNDLELTLSADFAEKIWVPDTFFANVSFLSSKRTLGLFLKNYI